MLRWRPANLRSRLWRSILLLVLASSAILWVRGYFQVDYLCLHLLRQADNVQGIVLVSRSGGIEFALFSGYMDPRHQFHYLVSGHEGDACWHDSQYRCTLGTTAADAFGSFVSVWAPPQPFTPRLSFLVPDAGDGSFSCGPFVRHYQDLYRDVDHLAYLWLPCWVPLLASSAALVYPIWRRHHRRPAGLCPTCGYDLRAHAPGQACPECGSLIARS